MADRVRQQWTGSGTGAMALGAVVAGFQAFPAAFHEQEVTYLVEHKGEGVVEVELGRGTYNNTTATVSRGGIVYSTNANSLVEFSAGTKHVSFVPLFADLVRTSDIGAMAAEDAAAGNRMHWSLVQLNATSGNVTFDGSNAAFVVRVHGTPGTARNLTITPAPTSGFPARSLLVINDTDADVVFLNHAAATIDTLATGTWQSFDWASSAWTAGAVFPGGSGSGIAAVAEDVAPVDVGDGGTLTASAHGEWYVSGSTLRRRKVRLRHASNQASAVTITVEDGLAQSIFGTVAADQTGLVTLQRASAATINGATSVPFPADPRGASFVLIPGPTNVYNLEGQTGEPVDFGGQIVGGNRAGVLLSISGSLTSAAHSGRVLVTSGNVTVPNAAGDVGFNATIIAGGAHTVTFNSVTSPAMGTGDVMSVAVQSTTVIKAVLVEAASLVVFS